jgi:hypothetical protein
MSGFAFGLTGCAMPPFDTPLSNEAGYPTVHQVIDKIQCEIAEARDSPTINADHVKKRLKQLNILPFNNWVANVTLTLTVTSTEGLMPSSSGLALAFIDPLKSAGNTFGFGGNAILYQQRSRGFTQTYTLEVNAIPPNESCQNIGRKWHDFNLEGDLGLKDQIYTGLHSFDSSDVGDFDVAKSGSPDNFGATVSFDIFKGVTAAGPTWTLVKFKASGGAGVQREDLHKIAVTFVPVALPSAKGTSQTQSQSVVGAMTKAQQANVYLVERQVLHSIADAINKP